MTGALFDIHADPERLLDSSLRAALRTLTADNRIMCLMRSRGPTRIGVSDRRGLSVRRGWDQLTRLHRVGIIAYSS